MPTRTKLWTFVFVALGLSYPVLSLVWRRDYPFLSGEILILAAGALFVAGMLAAVDGRPGGRVARLIAVSMVTAWVALLQFDAGPAGVIVALAAALALAAWLHTRACAVLLPVLAALLLGAWIDSFEDAGWIEHADAAPAVNRELPPVLHILLDGFIGMDGLPDYPASTIVRGEMERFFREFGMTAYPRAYSRYPTTGESLYAAMNFTHGDAGVFTAEAMSGDEHALRDNALFDSLAALGYRFNIYQTQHIDFCRSHAQATDRCWTYPHPNVLTIRQVDGLGERLQMLFKVLLMQSGMFIELASDHVTDPLVAVHDPRVLRELESDVLRGPGGRVFLAHVLLPHPPFAFLHDCSVNYPEDKRLRYAHLGTEGVVHPSVYEHRNLRYFEQMDCAMNSLRSLFARLREAGWLDRSVILLHGDHGSGIAPYAASIRNREALGSEDYRAIYSTLFAYRLPGGESALQPEALPLASLLEGYATAVSNLVKAGATPPDAANAAFPHSAEAFVYLVGGSRLAREEVDLFRH